MKTFFKLSEAQTSLVVYNQINLLRPLIQPLQHHLRTIYSLLQHHDSKIGYHKMRGNYPKPGTLDTFGDHPDSERGMVDKLVKGYRQIATITSKMKTTGKSDLDRFFNDLVSSIGEGHQLSVNFSLNLGHEQLMEENMFEMLRSNYNRLIRLLGEAHRLMEDHDPENYQPGVTQQYPMDATHWQVGDEGEAIDLSPRKR